MLQHIATECGKERDNVPIYKTTDDTVLKNISNVLIEKRLLKSKQIKILKMLYNIAQIFL